MSTALLGWDICLFLLLIVLTISCLIRPADLQRLVAWPGWETHTEPRAAQDPGTLLEVKLSSGSRSISSRLS